jgi:hypothetical protein
VGVQHAKIPEQADKFVAELESRLKRAYETAAQNKETKFDKAKLKNERFIRPFKYEVGSRVMINHPNIKVGSSSGLAIKYKGLFEVIGINANGVDYVVQNLDEKSKVFQVHHDRLKIYQGNFREYIDKKYTKRIEQKKKAAVTKPKCIRKKLAGRVIRSKQALNKAKKRVQTKAVANRDKTEVKRGRGRPKAAAKNPVKVVSSNIAGQTGSGEQLQRVAELRRSERTRRPAQQ